MKISWMWNCIRLCLLTGKTLHQVTFYAIQLLVLFPQQKFFLANLKTTDGENDFLEFLV